MLITQMVLTELSADVSMRLEQLGNCGIFSL